MNIAKEFHHRLRSARILRNMSQQDLAEKSTLPAAHISHLERGSRKPAFVTLAKLATALDVTTDFLMGLCPSLHRQEGDDVYTHLQILSAHDRETVRILIDVLRHRRKRTLRHAQLSQHVCDDAATLVCGEGEN